MAAGLVAAVGVRGALLTDGLLLPVLAVSCRVWLRRADDAAEVPERELELVRFVALFEPLPAVSLEHVARGLKPAHLEPGTPIITEGEAGDRFFLLAGGRAEVWRDGGLVQTLAAGDWFGEVALLRDLPRNATVTAAEPVELYTLDREDFVTAVTGNPTSAAVADEVVGRRQPMVMS